MNKDVGSEQFKPVDCLTSWKIATTLGNPIKFRNFVSIRYIVFEVSILSLSLSVVIVTIVFCVIIILQF